MSHWMQGKIKDLHCSLNKMRDAVVNIMPEWENFLIVDDTSSEANTPTRRIFCSHDQIQEVAYSLLTKEEKETTHLKIGRFLQDQNDPRQKS